MSITKNYVQSPNYTAGNFPKDKIVLHWWDDPKKKPQFGGIISWFQQKAAQVSIQYVVEAGRWTQMVKEKDMAWHAGNGAANRSGIGIEVNPRLSDGDYETTAHLVADIWRRRGKLPLRPHRDFTGTNCPGTMDIGRIRRRAEQILAGKPASKPAAKPAPKPAAKPAPKPAAKPKSNAWPDVALKVGSKHTKASHNAWLKLLGAVGYKGTVAQRLQRHLKKKGYYKGAITPLSRVGRQTTTALQRFLADRGFYKGRIDGSRGPQTVRSEHAFLNSQRRYMR